MSDYEKIEKIIEALADTDQDDMTNAELEILKIALKNPTIRTRDLVVIGALMVWVSYWCWLIVTL